jgi:hypothetical protein
MTDFNVVDFLLETPDGSIIKPEDAAGLGMTYSVGSQSKHYRFTLPVAIGAGQQAGKWHAVLQVNDDEFKRVVTMLRERKQKNFQSFATHGARYCVAVQTYSNLRMTAGIEQSGFEPGATVTIRATLTEYGIPVERRAAAEIELTRPGGSKTTVAMTEIEAGVFEGTFQANVSGVYQGRILARGVTLRGKRFTREQLVSAAVWRGGDRPPRPRPTNSKDELCRLLACLVNEKNLSREFEKRMHEYGISLDGIRACLKAFCRTRKIRRD